MSELDKINNCPVCGEKLIKEKYIDHYSIEDGSEVYYTDVKCLKKSWLSYHYHNIFDENGEPWAGIFWSVD